jgi:restriction endonuclease Mrr
VSISPAPSQIYLELPVLRCLAQRSPRSLSEIRDWVNRNVDLDPQDRTMVKMPSGKELRLFERTVGNLLTPGRAGNLTSRKLVVRPARDEYFITEEGKNYLVREEQLLAELKEFLKDVEF